MSDEPKRMNPLYRELAMLVVARRNCIVSSNTEWEGKHEERIESLVKQHLPSGSGFDNGTTLDLDASDGKRKLVFITAFHHMNEGGMYDGWTEHRVTITPAFDGFDMRISGRNRNEVKDYIGDVFHTVLVTEVEKR